MSEQNGQQVVVNEFDFDAQDLQPIEIPVKYQGHHYVLREASEDARVKWRNMSLKAAKFEVDVETRKLKSATMEGMADVEPFFVSRCLYKTGPDYKITLNPNREPDDRTLVPLPTLRAWPGRLVTKLFNKLKMISKADDDEVKKPEPDTIESLQAQIKALQDKLHPLLEKQEADQASGIPPGSGGQDDEDMDPNPTSAMQHSSS